MRAGRDLPKRSNERLLKNSPFENIPSCLRINSRFRGSFTTTPPGKVGIEIWKVSKPNIFSHFTNQENSLWRACKNKRPLPTSGSELGDRLNHGQHSHITTSQFIVFCYVCWIVRIEAPAHSGLYHPSDLGEDGTKANTLT